MITKIIISIMLLISILFINKNEDTGIQLKIFVFALTVYNLLRIISEVMIKWQLKLVSWAYCFFASRSCSKTKTEGFSFAYSYLVWNSETDLWLCLGVDENEIEKLNRTQSMLVIYYKTHNFLLRHGRGSLYQFKRCYGDYNVVMFGNRTVCITKGEI